MRKKIMLRLVAIFIAITVFLVPVSNVFAATTAQISVTASPAFISISNSSSTWTINTENSGSGKIAPSTTYYANPLGGATSPSSTVVDGECDWTITNTSTIATDLTCNWSDWTSGDASTNSNAGTAGATTYGAKVYYSGETFASAVTVKSSGSTTGNLRNNLGATTDVKWGLVCLTQTSAWTSGTAMTSTVTVTSTAH
jgi:hypothetical protein